MNRRYTGIIIGLFALAAAEFGLLGADAAGITGGGGSGVPPVVERQAAPTDSPTATPPLQTPFPLTPVSPPSADITGVFLQADPLTIQCDGSQESTVTVRLVQANGEPAPDGTFVYASAYNGSVNPYDATTTDGYATFEVRFYDDIFPYGPNFVVNSGLLQAGIRIRCVPVSDGGCPPSPPATSPPCEAPTPPPCGISPPAVSPPCVTATPTPDIETCVSLPPGQCEPTPTATPPSFQSPLVMVIGCGVGPHGIQSTCTANKASGTFEMGVYAVNEGSEAVAIEAFDVQVDTDDKSRLHPVPGASSGLNGNPDFEAWGEPTTWVCAPTIADSGGGEPGHARSVISCSDPPAASPIVLNPGGIRKLFSVHYDFPPDAETGRVVLSIPSGSIYDQFAQPLGWCDTGYEPFMECRDGTVDVIDLPPTPTMTPTATPSANFELALDCDLGQAGIQDTCSAPLDAGTLDVGVVLSNMSDVPDTLAAFNFDVRDDSEPLLTPPFIAGGSLDRNPDFNQAALPTDFFCDVTLNDRLTGDPTTAVSVLSCIDSAVESAPTIAGGARVQVATVHYNLLAAGGPATLELDDAHFYNAGAIGIGHCPETVERVVFIACRGVTVTILPAATPQPPVETPTPTVTNTPTPVLAITGTPEAGLALELAIDCDLAVTGIQNTCDVPVGDGTLDVGLVILNVGSVDTTLAAFNFDIRDYGQEVLDPPVIAGEPLDRNPDFDQASLGTNWVCNPVNNDLLPGDAAVAVSEASCYMAGALTSNVPVIVARSQLRVAVLHYNIIAAGGPVELGIGATNFYNKNIEEIGGCNPVIIKPFLACRGAVVTVQDGAAEGPTATATTANAGTPLPIVTATPVPVATTTPVRTATRAATTATRVARTATRKPGRRCADVDGDGRVTLEDVRLIARQIMRGLYDPRYDVNNDGRVSTKDAMRAIRQLGRRC
jgi:hypothetical protein